MVYFKDNSSPSGEHHLVILDDQHQPIEKGTILTVYVPLIGGRNVNPWPRLTNSFYLDEWSQEVSLNKNVKAWTLRATHHELPRYQQSNDHIPLRTLGRSIVEGDAKWDSDLQFTGDFYYTKGYWEWTEDVLNRCGRRLRLISVYDAVYASLFTYDHNFDIIKAFCEAWCPLTNTLLTSAGELSISLWDLHDLAGLPIMGCLYDEVVPSALELTGADEKGAIKYHLPPPRKEKKTVRPKSTHNPLGDIITHKRWSIAEEVLFEKLCIEENLKEEVYLVAYLACWLCTFVLPGKDVNSIRPSTFKMASMMANGRRVSLAIPVLASIYEASYFKTHYPIWQGLHGPKMTRFSGEGGAKYYDPQEARKRIHKAEFVFWACNMIVKNRPFKFIDNGDAEEVDHDYFIAIRSSYLTLRQGDKFIIEPYSPHRFGRQFCSNKNRHWKRQTKELTPLKAVETSASRSPSADFVAQLEDEIQSVDASEESDTSDSWTTTPPPFGMGLKGKQLQQPPAASVFEGESFLFSHHKEFLQKMWSDLLVKISNTPVDFLSSIEDDVSLILKSMKNFHKFDITPVEESLNTFFVKVRAYDEARSLSSQKLSRSLHEQHLKEAKARLQDVQAKASEGASKVQSIVDELEHVEKEIVALKERRTSLCAALKEQKQLNHDAQAKVHEVEEDIATLDNTAPFDDAIVENSKANLEIFKEDLKSLKLFA
ncbi:UNVERIFIED_CONTAM: hypothetical protein Slati_1684000 [Sesamum latifolium]|uniref:Aminotransferase-like plant mobile domain-containing protein n=1 Tax=Sesamum latifolium TaxID=2727402 RepID=A0AAW2WXQ6_9LAMI